MLCCDAGQTIWPEPCPWHPDYRHEHRWTNADPSLFQRDLKRCLDCGDTVPDDLPVLPYAGTSGYSGTDTSYDAAVWLDSTGVTANSQRGVLLFLRRLRHVGGTVAEIRTTHPELGHHGRVSGALSVLHGQGIIAMLEEKREHCHVYCLPEFVGDRGTVPPGRQLPRSRRDVDVHRAMLEKADIPFLEEPTRHRTPPVNAVSIITGDWQFRGVPVPEAPNFRGHQGCITEHVFDSAGALWAVWAWHL